MRARLDNGVVIIHDIYEPTESKTPEHPWLKRIYIAAALIAVVTGAVLGMR
jgi:hypothetical protein